MHRHYYAETHRPLSHQELDKQTAFHEAGHAAAIYLLNKQKQLPPVYFEIQINKPNTAKQHFSAKVIDGLLLNDLPSSILEDLSHPDLHSYQCAYEADVINLLVGPLAEAKYVSIRDDEIFKLNLINPKALHNYGGYSDVERAYDHLKAFISNSTQQEQKMTELLKEAYRFVDNRENWKCILNLAQYILDCGQTKITCEDVSSVFDRCIA
ncbi:hypothetical protein [Methylomarinum vadi]|uniref:hypothetical protein n=1 Tax=Methylomarinum vadi TaxID=438855 RepID=UPI0004DF2DCF|nr:hypothetical protein [Methylomarinum vadi]